jgi:ParB-like chromosome segregation protein Spo0J
VTATKDRCWITERELAQELADRERGARMVKQNNGMNLDAIRKLITPALTTGELADRVAALNAIRELIHELSPFNGEPVDTIRWVPADTVHANDYNPNSVAPPEMELLRLSIAADGYTQPIVTTEEDEKRVVIDGFHRTRVGKELEDVRERLMGYLPVVQIRADREDRGDRMASTIRHNRARGKHQVIAMSDIVLELKRRNWSDEKIGKQLGMDPDEVLRLTQITGLAEAFKDRDFSEAWEAVLDVDDEESPEVIDG